MILLRDKLLIKLKYFYGTNEEWIQLIEKTKRSTRKEVIVCDPYFKQRNYPKSVKVIRSIDTARRTLFLTDSIIFLTSNDEWTKKGMSLYLDSNSSDFYYLLSRKEALQKIMNKSVYIKVRNMEGYIK